MAAVLWTAAKFSVPREHKLALPRRLKTLLLHMARRSAQERPSAAEAIKVTGTRAVATRDGSCTGEGAWGGVRLLLPTSPARPPDGRGCPGPAVRSRASPMLACPPRPLTRAGQVQDPLLAPWRGCRTLWKEKLWGWGLGAAEGEVWCQSEGGS